MRVIFLASTLKLGGAERVTAEVSERLGGQGFSVAWALLREPGPEGERLRERGMEIASGLGPGRFDPFTPVRLRRHFRRLDAEALYCLDHQNAVVTGSIAAAAAGISRRFLAVHTTGLWGSKPSLPAGIRRVLSTYTKIVCVAENQADYLATKEGVDRSRLVVIRNGIDISRFAPTPECLARARSWREQVTGGAGAPLVGIVAALRPEKGHEVLFRAVARLRQAIPGFRLAVVGDGPERAALTGLADRLGIAGAVLFLGARDDVPDLLPAFDLVVLASHPSVETLPLALIEAMAAGRAVVATRVGSVEELVVDGVTGSLDPPADPAALAGAILRLAGDRILRERFGQAGAERARAFDIAGTVARTAALLRGEL